MHLGVFCRTTESHRWQALPTQFWCNTPLLCRQTWLWLIHPIPFDNPGQLSKWRRQVRNPRICHSHKICPSKCGQRTRITFETLSILRTYMPTPYQSANSTVVDTTYSLVDGRWPYTAQMGECISLACWTHQENRSRAIESHNIS